MAHPNMSYCMFENTLAALRQCADEFQEPASMQEELSPSEADAKESLVELCCEIAEQCGNTRDYSVEDAVAKLRSIA